MLTCRYGKYCFLPFSRGSMFWSVSPAMVCGGEENAEAAVVVFAPAASTAERAC